MGLLDWLSHLGVPRQLRIARQAAASYCAHALHIMGQVPTSPLPQTTSDVQRLQQQVRVAEQYLHLLRQEMRKEMQMWRSDSSQRSKTMGAEYRKKLLPGYKRGKARDNIAKWREQLRVLTEQCLSEFQVVINEIDALLLSRATARTSLGNVQ